MKTILNPILLFLFIFTLSCNNEELFVEDITQEKEEETNDKSEEDIIEEATAPCDFLLSQVEAGSEIVIDCLMDLEGEVVTLPSNTSIVYAGGDITNGELKFAGEGVISGELLNKDLVISGNSIKLKEDEFTFIPERWGIVEGEVSKEVAYKNHLIIQEIIDLIHKMDISTFKIDKMDAYFNTIREPSAANLSPIITLPSNFHLKMSENTFLRVFPIDDHQSSIAIRIYLENDITVSGGNLIGDRKQRGGLDGGLSLFEIKGGQNINVDHVTMNFSAYTGLTINSFLFEGNPDYVPSLNVTISNCNFDSNRANNLSITDGKGIIIENCTSFNAGNDLNAGYGLSEGVAPKVGIIVEADAGQVVENVIIRGNTVDKTVNHSILSAGSENVTIQGNTTDGSIGWTTTRGCKIIDNITDGEIFGGFSSGEVIESRDNEISGNTIKSAATGISASNDDILIYNNTIIDCKIGLMLRGLINSKVYNNTIKSDIIDAFGINAQQFVDNVTINNNTIQMSNVNSRPFYWTSVNNDEKYSEYKVYFKDNHFECTAPGSMVRGTGYEIVNNNFVGEGLGLTDMNNVLLANNSFKNNSGNCISINKYDSSKNIIVKDNVLENSSTERLSAYGILIHTVGNNATIENSNITLENNNISVTGVNYGIHSTNFDGMTIIDNIIKNTDRESIYFRGDDSSIINNQIKSVDIDGNGNSVSGNN
ncbi:right-handed parallel beta-helix repeat-containing protein [Tamlana sp. I1]|uniref:right-handed parallel beta-helix repeat-containing protein n=1 Tax=Tamlana sp. I1 TaxID=2762061 RepID=UPI00188FD78C|nr:right-handed parallel beta-helix repeat-containing protein [Tamlana sp. I1]